jgi:hypothetical protein
MGVQVKKKKLKSKIYWRSYSSLMQWLGYELGDQEVEVLFPTDASDVFLFQLPDLVLDSSSLMSNWPRGLSLAPSLRTATDYVLTAVVIKSYVLWDITPYSEAEVSWRFGGRYHIHFQDWKVRKARNQNESDRLEDLGRMLLRNVSRILPDYRALFPLRQNCWIYVY